MKKLVQIQKSQNFIVQGYSDELTRQNQQKTFTGCAVAPPSAAQTNKELKKSKINIPPDA